MMLRRVLILTVVLSLASETSLRVALAQVPPLRGAGPLAAQPLEADAQLGPQFTRGVEALLGQRLDEALAIMESLYRQSPRPTLLYYLGKVALLQQRQVAAADLYRRFLKSAGEEAEPELRQEAQQFLSATPSGECEVTVQGEAGALLLADGHIVGVLPLDQPLQLSPGAHKLALEKGRRKVETQVTLSARRRAEVRFTLLPPLALLTLTPGVLLLTQTEPKELEPALTPLLQSSMQTALAQQNAVLISSETQAELLQRAPNLSGCLGQLSCQERLGQMASAQFVLSLSTKAEGGASGQPFGQLGDKRGVFRFVAKLLDVDVGLVSVQATQSCADCNIKQALSQLEGTVQELLRQAVARPRGVLVVESDPPGALVQLDGHTLGTTPYRREAFIGPHSVVIRKAGYTQHTANISISESGPTELRATLPISAPVVPPSPRGKRIAKWTLLGAGAVLTVVGATLLGLNGRQSCTGSPSVCTTFDGQAPGVPLLVFGVGALGASGVLFLLDRSSSPSPTPQPAGAGVTLLGF